MKNTNKDYISTSGKLDLTEYNPKSLSEINFYITGKYTIIKDKSVFNDGV